MINVPAVVLSQNQLVKKEYSHWQFFDHQLYIVQDVLRDLGYKPYNELIAWLENDEEFVLGGNMVYLEKHDDHVEWGYIRLEESSQDKTKLSYEQTKDAFKLWHDIKDQGLQAIAITKENDKIRMMDFEQFKKEQNLCPEPNVFEQIYKELRESGCNLDDDEPCDCKSCQEEENNSEQ